MKEENHVIEIEENERLMTITTEEGKLPLARMIRGWRLVTTYPTKALFNLNGTTVPKMVSVWVFEKEAHETPKIITEEE